MFLTLDRMVLMLTFNDLYDCAGSASPEVNRDEKISSHGFVVTVVTKLTSNCCVVSQLDQ